MPRPPSPTGARFDEFQSHERSTEFNVHFHPVRPMRKEIHPLSSTAVLLIVRYPNKDQTSAFSRVLERQNTFVWNVSAFNEPKSRTRYLKSEG